MPTGKALSGDGAVVYPDGYGVACWRDGAKTTVARHELVEAVVAPAV